MRKIYFSNNLIGISNLAMNMRLNPNLIPEISRYDVKAFDTTSDAWKNFAQRITQHPFVREYLLHRDGYDCSWCSKLLVLQAIIHHITYNHSCSFNKTIRINTPTENRIHKTRLIPDCEQCKADCEQRFQNCMSKLVLVHQGCNKAIAEKKPTATY